MPMISLESRQAIYRPAGALAILQCFHQSPGRLFIDLPVLQQYCSVFTRVPAGYLQTCRCSSKMPMISLESRQAIYRPAGALAILQCFHQSPGRLFIDLPVLQQNAYDFTRVPAGYLQTCRCSSNIAVFSLESRQAIYRPAGALAILQCFHQSPGRLFIDLPVLQQYAYDFTRVPAGYLQICRCSSDMPMILLESRQAIYRPAGALAILQCFHQSPGRLFIDLPVLQQYAYDFTRESRRQAIYRSAGALAICL